MEKKPDAPKDSFIKGLALWLLLGLLLFLVIKTTSTIVGNQKTLNYSDFFEEVEKGNIQGTVVIKHGYIYGNLKDGTRFQTYAGEDDELLSILRENKVSFRVEPASDFWA